MDLWTAEDKAIIAANHVTAKTYDAQMEKAGGFRAYVKGLGGIFDKVYAVNTQVATVQELHERMRFVCGLMAIFRFCYWNGTTWWYWLNSASKSFYSSKVTNKGCRGGTIYQLCHGDGGRLRITNCNYGCDTALRALGIFKHNSIDKAWLNEKGARKVTLKRELKPGDLVHFYRISDGKWHHVVMVHSIEGGKVWMYDFGSRFIRTGKPLHYMALNDSSAAGGEYGTDKWKAWHIMDLEEDKPVKDDTDMAVEMYRAAKNSLNVLKKEYGDKVTTICANMWDYYPEYLRAAADYVLDEFAGKGEARKAFFGEDYDDVQAKVMWVIQAAKDVVAGKYGNDEERRAKLGADWQVVQNEVNRMKKRGEF